MQVKKRFKNFTLFHFLLASLTFFAGLIIFQVPTLQITYLQAFIPELSSTQILNNNDIQIAKVYRLFTLVVIFFMLTAMACLIRRHKKEVTQFKKLLLDLQRQQSALNSHAIVSITDKTGKILYVNEKFTDISGYSTSELLGQNHRLLNSRFHTKEFFVQMWETICRGEVWHADICNRAKDGHLYWVQSSIVPFLNDDNKVESYISIRTDISKQKEMEYTAIKSEEWQRTILNNLGDGVYLLDLQGRLTYLNAAGERLFGYSFSELKQRFVHDLLHHHSADGIFLPYQECEIAISMHKEVVYQSDNEVFFRKNGEKFPASVCSVPLYESGRLIGTVVCFRDISEQRAIQQQLIEAKDAAEKATRVKSEFLSTMSHEIRTPMNGIIGMTELLLDTPLNAEQLEFATIIKSSANSLLGIINDILDFSKIEAGQFELENLNFSFNDVIDGSTDVIAARAYEKSLSLISYIDPKIPEHLLGDPMRLRQIVLNFLSNAVKFTLEGTVLIKAILLQQNTTTVWVRVEITDSGIGISQETQKRLFQPFSQADSSTTRKYGGTGLGLSICKKLVELMHGRIGVDSELEQGSTFWIELPFQLASNFNEHIIDATKLKNKRILVSGYEEGHHEIYISYLQSWKISVHSCENMATMQALLEQVDGKTRLYDAILLGAGLEIKELLQTIRLIRAQTTFQNIPIIVCQSSREASVRHELLDCGANQILTNPVKQSILFDSLVEIFYQKMNTKQSKKFPEMPANKIISQSGKIYRLLLVEDNAVNQQIAIRLLTKMGFIVDVANNGQEAFDILITNSNYDLILMDCQMPIMDGFVTTRRIRHHELNHKLARMPIVAMTANAMQGDRERCLDTGMDDYISKPIEIEKLQQTLKKWLIDVDDVSGKTSMTELKTFYPQNEPAAIDMRRMLNLFEGDEEIIDELFGVFYESIEPLKEKLADSVKEQSENITKITHNIKGSSANIGAEILRELCRQLENIASTKNWADIETLATKVEQELNRVKAFIENRINEK